MRKFHLAAAAAVSAVLLAVPAVANHSWGKYHWATVDGTLKVKVSAALTDAWVSSFETAIADWDGSPDLELTPAIASGVSRKKCTPIAGQILVCNDLYGQRGWLGIASIWADSKGHITQGTTKLNDTYFNMTRYNTDSWRQFVTCQEIGHDFGLAHQDENFSNTNLGSCMDYTNDPSGKAGTNGTNNNEHPDTKYENHDFGQLALIYNHTNDGYTTANPPTATNFGIREFGKPAAPPRQEDFSGDSPAEWGRAIHQDGLGRPDVFVQDLPNGGRKITHVFWALETKRSEIHHD